MTAIASHSFPDAVAMLRGLGQLRRRGVTPRGLLFLALDPRGVVYLAVPEDVDEVARIRVGEKMAFQWPFEGRYFYFDSVHRLRGDVVLFNGDRRLQHPGNAAEVASMVAGFLKTASAKNVFFGCTPHQPGSWMYIDPEVVALHELGFVEVVPAAQGLLARAMFDNRLFFLPFTAVGRAGEKEAWEPVFTSPLGNLVMLERRVMGSGLVLTCEHGLLEVDVQGLPRVTERARVPLESGFGVVGRIDGGAFAVTVGKPQPWGLEDTRPALLVGAEGGGLAELAAALAHTPAG